MHTGGMDARDGSPWSLVEPLEPPSHEPCDRHVASRTVAVRGDISGAGEGGFTEYACPSCALTGSLYTEVKAVWDGRTWLRLAAAIAPFREQYLTSLALPPERAADAAARWEEATALPGPFELTRLRAWAYSVQHPELDVRSAYQLLDRAERLVSTRDDVGWVTPFPSPPSVLMALVAESRSRWETYFGSAWMRLEHETREAVVHLRAVHPNGPLPGDAIERLPPLATRDLRRAFARVDRSWKGWPIRFGDLSVWDTPSFGSPFNNKIRSLARYAEELGYPAPSGSSSA